MSFRSVAWALDDVRGLSPAARMVLVSLAEFANQSDESTWVSRERLMVRVECSKRALVGYLKELEVCGAISRRAYYVWCESEGCGVRGEHKHRKGTVYQLYPDRKIDVRAATSVESAPVESS